MDLPHETASSSSVGAPSGWSVPVSRLARAENVFAGQTRRDRLRHGQNLVCRLWQSCDRVPRIVAMTGRGGPDDYRWLPRRLRETHLMLPLYQDHGFTFRFAENRLVPRFHLEGVTTGHRVTVFAIDPDTGNRRQVLAKVTAGDSGWVDLAEPLVVRAGGGFVAVPVPAVAVRAEAPDDLDAIRAVNRIAFGQEDEASLVDALRDGEYIQASLVAEVVGHVVGHILFSELSIITATETVPALALAPMAVLPEFQHLGVGSELVRRGLDVCREQGHTIVVVVGHPRFYPRFGFSPAPAARLTSPFSSKESFMALAIVPGALDGVEGRVEYPPSFGTWV